MPRPIQTSEIRQRIREFRHLCASGHDSDLSGLLDDIERGEDQIIAAAVEEIDGTAIGWAVCERFRRWVVLNVFVQAEHRRRGHATALVNDVLRVATERDPGVRPLVEPEPLAFWGQFPNVSAVDA